MKASLRGSILKRTKEGGTMTSKERRPKGSGTIRQRGRNTWELRYDATRDEYGRRQRVAETVHGSRSKAEAMLRRRLGEVETGAFVPKTNTPLQEYLTDWLENYATVHTRPSTLRGYAGSIRLYIIPVLGQVPLQKLRPAHVQKVHAEMLAAGLSKMTVLHAHTVLSEALKHAVRQNLLARNPAQSAPPPRPERKELVMWPVEVVQQFLVRAPTDMHGNMFRLDVYTGLRRSELIALKWEVIDLDAAILSVRRALIRATGAGLLEGEPKTARSRRTISVGSEAVSILKAVRVQQAEQRLKAGAKWQDLGYVFTQASGRPLDPDDASGRFAELVRELNLAHLTLHGLRHAHATLLIKQGVHLKVVQERMGHSSITVTADLYGHLLPGMDAEAAGRLDQLLTKGDPARLSASGNFRPIGRK